MLLRPGPADPVERDGPGANPPPNLAALPDAVPRVETIRPGGANKPYEAMGELIRPLPAQAPFTQAGLASWYGGKFHGRRTANGEVFDMYALSAAHRTLPLPSFLKVRNPANGREIVVRVNDRGPFHGQRILDLSYAAAVKLDLQHGVGQVEIERITPDDIRTGQWQRPAASPRAPAQAAARPIAAAAPGVVPADTPAASEPTAPARQSLLVVSAADAAVPVSPSPLPIPVDGAAVPAPARTAVAAVAAVAADNPVASRGTAEYWLQLAAFRQADGAEGYRQRLAREAEWLAPVLRVSSDDSGMRRVQAGPYPSRDQAQNAAARVREALKLSPLVLERR